MVYPNLQPTLFSTSKEEALDLAKTSVSHAKLWYNQNYLSFDISKVNELQHYELLELVFISELFKSELELEIINQLLLKLPKPFAYDYNTIYFNIFTNSWEYFPNNIEEEEIVERYLENLDAEDDREKIEELINNLQEKLK
jgi:hypothetical protein